MPPKKGLSAEEKREKLLEFFTKSHSFYTLKEIEKDGSKYTKISPMLIKDIVQQLLDESFINCEKCGTTNLYWSFKFDKFKALQTQKRQIQLKIEEMSKKELALVEKLQLAKLQRTPKFNSTSRKVLIEKYLLLSERKKDLEKALQKYNEMDPKSFDQLSERKSLYLQAIETITDSIEQMIYYFSKESEFPVDPSALRIELGIPPEFEDVNTLL